MWNPQCVACHSSFRLESPDGIALCEYCRKNQQATMNQARAMIDTYNALLVDQIEALCDDDSDRYSAMYHADCNTPANKRASFERRIQRTIDAGGALAVALITRNAMRKAVVHEQLLRALYAAVV
jgi:transcription elongation factor Elf1